MKNKRQIQAWRAQRLREMAAKEGGKAALGRRLGYRDGAFIGQMLRGDRPITEKTIFAVENLPGYERWFEPPKNIDNEIESKENFASDFSFSDLPRSLSIVVDALQNSDEITRTQIRPLFDWMLDKPERASEVVPRISALLAREHALA